MNSVVKMNSKHTILYHHYGRSNHKFDSSWKTSPQLFFSFKANSPVPPPRSKGIFPHESRKQGNHTEGQTAGNVWLMSIPEIHFCALVKYRAQHDTSWAFTTTTCWNFKCWDQKCQGFAAISPSITCFAHIGTELISLFNGLFFEHLLRDFRQT